VTLNAEQRERVNRILGRIHAPKPVSHPVFYPRTSPAKLQLCYYCGHEGTVTRTLGMNVCGECQDLPALDYDRV
jgi:hypothetical protein